MIAMILMLVLILAAYGIYDFFAKKSKKIEKNYLKDIYGESWTREGVIEPLKWENGAIYLIDSINMRTNIIHNFNHLINSN